MSSLIRLTGCPLVIFESALFHRLLFMQYPFPDQTFGILLDGGSIIAGCDPHIKARNYKLCHDIESAAAGGETMDTDIERRTGHGGLPQQAKR